VTHVFLNVVWLGLLWGWFGEITCKSIGMGFDLSLCVCWLSDKKISILNVFSSTILWTLWKTHNDLYFQNIQ
jgi:hypothetical protein